MSLDYPTRPGQALDLFGPGRDLFPGDWSMMTIMATMPEYLTTVHNQLHLAGAKIYRTPVGPVTATVAELHEQQAIGSYRYCVTITTVDAATAFLMEDFTRHSVAFSQTLDVPHRGWTSSVMVIAAVIANSADHQARTVAFRKPSTRFGTVSRSVLVELSTGLVSVPRSAPFWGGATYTTVRKTMHHLFPAPQAVATLPNRPL